MAGKKYGSVAKNVAKSFNKAGVKGKARSGAGKLQSGKAKLRGKK